MKQIVKVNMTKDQLNQLKKIKKIFDTDLTGMAKILRGDSFGNANFSLFENFLTYVKQFGNEQLVNVAILNEKKIKNVWRF